MPGLVPSERKGVDMWYVDEHVAKILTDGRRRLFVEQMGCPVEGTFRSPRTVSGPLGWLTRQGGCFLANVGRRLTTLGSRLERYGAPQPSLQ